MDCNKVNMLPDDLQTVIWRYVHYDNFNKVLQELLNRSSIINYVLLQFEGMGCDKSHITSERMRLHFDVKYYNTWCQDLSWLEI